MHPSSAPWLQPGGVCWVGKPVWVPHASVESGTCMGTHSQTRYRGLHFPTPAPLKGLTQQTSLHAAFSAPSSIFAVFHWLIFLAHCTSWARLQEILYLPKLAAERGCVGPSLAMVFTSLLLLPARYRQSLLLTGHHNSGVLHPGLVKKETCVCKCM